VGFIKLRDYRAVWDAANVAGFVDAARGWGDNVDIDHVFPKSWANFPGSNLEYVRLFPVWAEIKQGIVYARELQVLTILVIPLAPK
jgi:hypothetical protein